MAALQACSYPQPWQQRQGRSPWLEWKHLAQGWIIAPSRWPFLKAAFVQADVAASSRHIPNDETLQAGLRQHGAGVLEAVMRSAVRCHS